MVHMGQRKMVRPRSGGLFRINRKDCVSRVISIYLRLGVQETSYIYTLTTNEFIPCFFMSIFKRADQITKSYLTLMREAFITPLSTSSRTSPVACRTTISSGATELLPIDTKSVREMKSEYLVWRYLAPRRLLFDLIPRGDAPPRFLGDRYMQVN